MFEIQITKIESTKHTNDGTFLQTPFWCEFKARHGWSYRRFVVTVEKNVFELAVLNRAFCKNLFSIAYVPLMPKKFFDDTIDFAAFLQQLAYSLKTELPSNTIAVRFDPDVSFETVEERDEYNLGMKTVAFADRLKLYKSRVDIQPPDSTLVNLSGSEEQILEKMHSKWRYNIRLSERRGVIVKRYLGNDANLSEKIDKFYELTKITNARDGNASHAKAYYKELIKSSSDCIDKKEDVPLISLYIAEHEGEEIAAIMTLFSHDEAVYLYGASSNSKRNLMPNHLLQWTAMKDAKQYGSPYYDMYGMPPEGKNERHPMHGLYMFKANFGGKNIHRTGSWDVALKPIIYRTYSAAEKMRAFWHKKVLKRLKGR